MKPKEITYLEEWEIPLVKTEANKRGLSRSAFIALCIRKELRKNSKIDQAYRNKLDEGYGG